MGERAGVKPETEKISSRIDLTWIVGASKVYRMSDYDYDYEPDIDFGFEHDSAMASAGWFTDEDYGYYGGDDDYGLIGGDSDLWGEM